MRKYLMMLLVVSCVNETNSQLTQLKSKPIELPLRAITLFDNKNNIDLNNGDNNLKMVIYTDSSNCTTCSISSLYLWSTYIDYTSKFDKKMLYYFIFNPPHNDITSIIRNSFVDYPILIDSLGEFECLNPHLPKNKAMHTFLLDEDNNVILVGNPLQNKQIEKMFYEEVEKRLK